MAKFRTIYDHSKPVSPHGGVSMTDQQYLKDCDINSILKTYRITGQVNCTVRPEGISGDFSSLGDFQACMDKVNRGVAEFEALPAELRARFGNDPKSYVDFVLNPDNVDECIKLGLRVMPEPKSRTAVEVLESIERNVTPKGEDVAK